MPLNVPRSSTHGGQEGSNSVRLYSTTSEVRKSCSIVLQDNHVELAGRPDATLFLSGTGKAQVPRSGSKDNASRGLSSREPAEHTKGIENALSHRESGLTNDTDTKKAKGTGMKKGSNEGLFFPKRHLSFDTTLKQRGQIHLQSADLFDNFSPVQKERGRWKPTVSDVYSMETSIQMVPVEAPELPQYDAEELRTLYPKTFGMPCLEIHPSPNDLSPEVNGFCSRRPLRVGIVLSGGPAPGGHNVISGLFDYIKSHHPESQMFGFMGGLDGVFQAKYRVVSAELMDRFRNQGGFDMLWSGRGRINNAEDLRIAQQVCSDLGIQGLVIVGGDGSLSNAARLAEYFAEHLPSCSVIGVPKTIDGDLQNPWIETSFGFDTAAKTYSEVIGNLCTDVTTGQQAYHFVRVMGRSASHLVLECALQTRPNLVFVGEEVEANNVSLKMIVDEIVDLIIARKAKGKAFGIVLVPEGLIEFIPEIKCLISELNTLMTDANAEEPNQPVVDQVAAQLQDPVAQSVWKFLPESIQEQLLLDRESTGYIQVARIATERLLKLLVENELQRRDVWTTDMICMPHYFGYEGRCAMPSNFDANYCYSLGHTAGCLIEHEKNGYVSVTRHLDQHPTLWTPAAIPFTRIMHIKMNSDKTTFPAVTRQLVDLKGQLFKVFCQVRDCWKLLDYYRCPGPIQFEGPVADIANYTVALPTKEKLLGGIVFSEQSSDNGEDAQRCRKLGSLSHLQKQRLQDRPDLPALCQDVHARAVAASQYLPKDPFTQRQILSYYPYLCNGNQFNLQEVIQDRNTAPVHPGLRVAVVLLSRQSPGVTNVLWGVHERLKLVGGRCFGFYGSDGLLSGRYLEITDDNLELHLNQGGMELLGRATVHSLLAPENQEKARITCEKLYLNGLVIVGSSLAMTEATLTAEYFLTRGCRTAVVGVPATGSNNLAHELIETNIGFDTSSKLYASLIGNVLTDAASMPKYWHFVRLMGRQPSNEVLECALQTHPNVVIIAEEYGAANKTLCDVVMDIADVVVKRAHMGKNFGSVLIPDGLLSHLPNMNALMNELASLVREAERSGRLKELQQQLENIEEYGYNYSPSRVGVTPVDDFTTNWTSCITPWSMALFKSLPKFIRKELTQVDMGEMRFTLIETELLLSQMVQQELERRKKQGNFNGKFSAVCHFFGYQGRSAMPSRFDAQLAFAYGHLAAICVESGLTGYCCTIRGLCGDKKDWKLGAVPLNSMLMFTAQQDSGYAGPYRGNQSDVPIIPSAEVNLNGKAYRWLRAAVGQWQLQDRFCNPGPVQFYGKASHFYHRMLHEEQAEYFNMLRHVQLCSRILRDTCSFGVDENFLKVVYANLNALLVLRFHPDDLMNALPAFVDIQKYDAWQQSTGQRPEVWRTEPDHPVTGAMLPDNLSADKLERRASTKASRAFSPGISEDPRAPSPGSGNITPGDTASVKPRGSAPDVGLLSHALRSRSTLPASQPSSGALSTPDIYLSLQEIKDNLPLDSSAETTTRLGTLRHCEISDAGWGDQPGVEAYPRSTTGSTGQPQ